MKYYARPTLSQLRREAGLRQADVAVMISERAEKELSVALYNKIEQGERKASSYHANLIAKFFNKPIPELFTWK